MQAQQARITQEKSFPREALSSIETDHSPVAAIITGVRRCGKST